MNKALKEVRKILALLNTQLDRLMEENNRYRRALEQAGALTKPHKTHIEEQVHEICDEALEKFERGEI